MGQAFMLMHASQSYKFHRANTEKIKVKVHRTEAKHFLAELVN